MTTIRYFWRIFLKQWKLMLLINHKIKLIFQKWLLLIIANHPFGIIDGLILCSIVSEVRGDFKIMTHETLKLLPQLEEYILPVDFSGNDRKSLKFNLETGRKAENHLKNQGALIIFPSGSVSVAKDLKSAQWMMIGKHFL